MEHQVTPNCARSPYLNGKVERVQKTDFDEFYSTVALHQPIQILNQQLEGFQDYYNWECVHGSLGVTPEQCYYDRSRLIPHTEEVTDQFDPVAERQQHRFFGYEWLPIDPKTHKRLGDQKILCDTHILWIISF